MGGHRCALWVAGVPEEFPRKLLTPRADSRTVLSNKANERESDMNNATNNDNPNVTTMTLPGGAVETRTVDSATAMQPNTVRLTIIRQA